MENKKNLFVIKLIKEGVEGYYWSITEQMYVAHDFSTFLTYKDAMDCVISTFVDENFFGKIIKVSIVELQ